RLDELHDLDQLADLDLQAGFLAHLAPERGLEGFAELDAAARERPPALVRRPAAPDEQPAPTRPVEDERPAGDPRPRQRLDHRAVRARYFERAAPHRASPGVATESS